MLDTTWLIPTRAETDTSARHSRHDYWSANGLTPPELAPVRQARGTPFTVDARGSTDVHKKGYYLARFPENTQQPVVGDPVRPAACARGL